MSGYKVSYDVLSQQGQALVDLAQKVDGYAAEVNAIRNKLGSDDLLLQVRNNLSRLSQQLGESRAILNMAGKVVETCVQDYGKVESSSVKKVDSARAHNRDFYKNPVVVASAGAAAAVNVSVGSAASASSAGAPVSAPASASASDPVSAAPAAFPDAAAAAGSAQAEASAGSTVNILRNHVTVPLPEQTPPAPSAAAPMTKPDLSAPAPASGGGASAAQILGGAAVGAAAGAAGLFGASKLRQFLREREERRSNDLGNLGDEELAQRLRAAKADLDSLSPSQEPEE